MGLNREDGDGTTSTQAIFSTEVPQDFMERHQGSGVGRDSPGGDDGVFRTALQEQIGGVVLKLEQVLRGLKEVQLEMKEVIHASL